MSAPRAVSHLETNPASDADAPSISRWDTFLAVLGFAVVDCIVAIGGYRRLYRVVRRWRVRPAPHADGHTLVQVNAAVERAALLYPRQALCLPRSAVATCLLRRRGVPAQMVIGARKIPFYAHAWVEVNDHVVNDTPAVKTRYPELDRF